MLLGGFEVGESQLHLDDAEVFQWVARARHVGIAKGSQDEHDGVDLANAGQELVAQALTLGCPLDQAANVGELHAGWDDLLRGTHLGQTVKTNVGDLGHADIRVSGGECVRGGQGAASSQCVVQR